MPRNTNTIDTDLLNRPGQEYSYFLRMIWPDITHYWTTRSAGVDSFSLFLTGEAGAYTWDATQVWEPGDFAQSEQSRLTISDITLGNADNVMGQRVKKYGWRNLPVTVWIAYYDATTHGVVDSFKVYDGVGDRAEVGDVIRGSLLPFTTPQHSKFPRRMFTPAFGFNFIPPQNLKFPWGNVTAQAPGGQALQPGAGPPAKPWWEWGDKPAESPLGDLGTPPRPDPVRRGRG